MVRGPAKAARPSMGCEDRASNSIDRASLRLAIDMRNGYPSRPAATFAAPDFAALAQPVEHVIRNLIIVAPCGPFILPSAPHEHCNSMQLLVFYDAPLKDLRAKDGR